MIYHQESNSFGNYNYNSRIYGEIMINKHFHKNYELIYIFSGEIEVCVNSNTVILPQGKMLLVSPFDIHSLNIDKKSSVWVAVFSADYIGDFAKKYSNMSFSEFPLDADVLDFLKNRLLITEPTDLYTKKACLYAVCAQCIKNSSRTNYKRNENFIRGVIDYVSDHLTEDILMTDVAKHLNFDSHYFSSLFHKYFSMNFREFLNMYRYDYACEMLMSENISITEAATRSGFSCVRSFNRVFLKFSGKTPSKFRSENFDGVN